MSASRRWPSATSRSTASQPAASKSKSTQGIVWRPAGRPIRTLGCLRRDERVDARVVGLHVHDHERVDHRCPRGPFERLGVVAREKQDVVAALAGLRHDPRHDLHDDVDVDTAAQRRLQPDDVRRARGERPRPRVRAEAELVDRQFDAIPRLLRDRALAAHHVRDRRDRHARRLSDVRDRHHEVPRSPASSTVDARPGASSYVPIAPSGSDTPLSWFATRRGAARGRAARHPTRCRRRPRRARGVRAPRRSATAAAAPAAARACRGATAPAPRRSPPSVPDCRRSGTAGAR